MARDIIYSASDYSGSNALYFVAYDITTLKWINGTALETYNASHWTSYAIALTLDATTGEYYGSFPQVGNGDYFVKIYEKLGATAATSDTKLTEDTFEWNGYSSVPTSSDDFLDQLAIDAVTFIDEFSELVTYNPYGGTPRQIRGDIERNPASVIGEDGKVLAEELAISIHNDPTLGASSINIGKDTIICAARFGGPAAEHLVTAVISSDAGIQKLRLRG